MNQPTLRPVVVPDRPRPAGFRAACLALLSALLLPTFTARVKAETAVTSVTGGSLFRFNNQGFTVGYEFTVSQTVTVDSLGFYDEGNDGLVTAHDVGIFDLCGTLRASGTVAVGTGSPLNGGYRYVSITPVVLAAGTYRIGAVVFNGGSNDRFLHAVATVATDSIVTYVRGKINNGVASLQFPTLDATATGLQEKGCFGPNFTFTPGGTPPVEPEANVKGNNVSIADGDTSPDTADETGFGGTAVVGETVVRTFTIENTGTANLVVSGISKGGTHASDFTVGPLNPASPIPAGGSATFTVTFDPSAVGLRTATISIASNDCDENPYDFAVEGVGTNTAPTVERDAATVTVPEGTTAFNSGTFADANGDTVTVTASVGTITQSTAWTHQQTLTQGGQPVQLVLDSEENLYVVNDIQNKVYKYDSSGSLVTSWTVTGAPSGVAVDSANGWLYVVPRDGHRVDKFTLSGTLLTSWGSFGSGNGQFNLPVGVAVDAAGDVYVTEYFNHRIQVFSPSGTFLRKWGTAGSGNGQFSTPQGLRVSPGGTVYVADRGNNRVQYFDTAGTYLGQWGSAGSGNGQFNGPAGIGIDPGGNVVVGDIFNNRIQKFTATGTYVDKLGPSTTVGNLSLPHGTAFPPSGRSVYIADFNNGRVVKFATPGGWNWSYTPADGAAGPTTVTITATDNGSPNLSSTATFTLNVNNVAPTIALSGNATVPNGTPYTLNLGVITDPGTDTVSAFSIDWGDGNTENFAGNPASTTKSHTYATLGEKTITVTLTDEDGTFTGGTRSVTVENAAPVAAADGLNRPNTTKVAKVLKSVLLANDSDADGDPLTLTAVGNALPAGATVAMAGNFVVYTAPANNAGNGSFTYTLSAGAHTVTGTVPVTETTTSGGGDGTPNHLTIAPSGNDFIVTFLGVPGGSFRVQYSTAGPPNFDWQEFAPPAIYTAAPNGVFTHTDVNPPSPVRFYRAVSNP
jgi:DNA-binding beta-propeller fold protein YncE